MKVIGNIKKYTIIRKCAYCGDEFLLSCNDYVLNIVGCSFINSENRDDWVCPACYDKIKEIKIL